MSFWKIQFKFFWCFSVCPLGSGSIWTFLGSWIRICKKTLSLCGSETLQQTQYGKRNTTWEVSTDQIMKQTHSATDHMWMGDKLYNVMWQTPYALLQWNICLALTGCFPSGLSTSTKLAWSGLTEVSVRYSIRIIVANIWYSSLTTCGPLNNTPGDTVTQGYGKTSHNDWETGW